MRPGTTYFWRVSSGSTYYWYARGSAAIKEAEARARAGCCAVVIESGVRWQAA